MSGPLALWRTDSHLERELVEESRCSLRQRLSIQAFAVSCIVAPFVAFVPASEAFFLGPAMAMAVLISLLGVSSLGLSAQAKSVRRWNARLLGEEYSIAGGFLAKITIFVGEALIGSDRGIVWSEDGRLYFAGPRTSFGLFASQIDASEVEEGQSDLRLRLRVASKVGPVSLRLSALTEGKEIGQAQQQAQFTWRVRSWLAQGSVGDGQWPPLTLGPDAPGAGVLFIQAVVSTLYWAALPFLALGFVVLVFMTWFIGIALLPAFLGGIKAGFGVFDHPPALWNAWSDRRRLDAALRQDRDR